MQPRQWEHLRYTAEEVNGDVKYMEGVFAVFAEPKRYVSAKERLITLKQLARIVTPEYSLKLCVRPHSRRLVE